MKDQPELFDSGRYEKGEEKTLEPDHIMARRTDPMSSLVAAEEAKMSGRRDTQARDVLRARGINFLYISKGQLMYRRNLKRRLLGPSQVW